LLLSLQLGSLRLFLRSSLSVTFCLFLRRDPVGLSLGLGFSCRFDLRAFNQGSLVRCFLCCKLLSCGCFLSAKFSLSDSFRFVSLGLLPKGALVGVGIMKRCLVL